MKLLAILLLGSLTISFIAAKKTYIIETADDEDNNGEDFAAEVKETGKSNENKDTWKDNNKWKKGDAKWQSGDKWKGKGGKTWTDKKGSREIDSKETEKEKGKI